MAGLVPIPWQPQYFVTPDTLALLVKASGIAGHNIQVVDAWREYAQQKYLYNGWINHLPGFNLASNPDDPNAQNNHLRAAAVDILNRGDRAAMLAAGFTPDSVEWWHFNNPNWRNMPIIKTNTSVASTGGTPIDNSTAEEDDMTKINLLRNGDGSGSVGTVNPDGTLDGLTSDELNAILRAGMNQTYPQPDGSTSPYHQEGDGAVWGILAARTARLRAAQHGDPTALAQSVAALTIPAVLAGLKTAGATGLTEQQVQDAAEAAVREVFADAAT
jgi:hypothetical protein